MGEVRNAYEILIRRSEQKRQLGRLRHRWKDNIKNYSSLPGSFSN
jgi:hypothetical protein